MRRAAKEVRRVQTSPCCRRWRILQEGSEPLGVAFVFSAPGFEELMRENSVPEGEPVTPISAQEREQIRKRHGWHTSFPPG